MVTIIKYKEDKNKYIKPTVDTGGDGGEGFYKKRKLQNVVYLPSFFTVCIDS